MNHQDLWGSQYGTNDSNASPGFTYTCLTTALPGSTPGMASPSRHSRGHSPGDDDETQAKGHLPSDLFAEEWDPTIGGEEPQAKYHLPPGLFAEESESDGEGSNTESYAIHPGDCSSTRSQLNPAVTDYYPSGFDVTIKLPFMASRAETVWGEGERAGDEAGRHNERDATSFASQASTRRFGSPPKGPRGDNSNVAGTDTCAPTYASICGPQGPPAVDTANYPSLAPSPTAPQSCETTTLKGGRRRERSGIHARRAFNARCDWASKGKDQEQS